MGLCGSKANGSSDGANGTQHKDGALGPGVASAWDVQVKLGSPSGGGSDHQPLLGTESVGGPSGATTTPVQAFAEHESASVPESGGGGGGLTSRFFKRGPAQPVQPQPLRPGGSSGDAATGVGGAAPPPPGTAAAAAAAAAAASGAAAAAAAAAAATAAGAAGGTPNAAGAASAAAPWRSGGAAASRCDAVAQTDASLLYPLLRDPSPTVPVRWRKGEGIGSGSFGQVYLALNCDTGEFKQMLRPDKCTRFLVLS